MKSQELRWNIAELEAVVERALAVDYAGARNGQVREVPDARTIRYYASLGLVDPPVEMRGRTAFYSRRHLLQIVAVKRLQAAGMALVEVQQQLVGLTDAALGAIAKLPADVEQRALAIPVSEPTSPHHTGAPAFWAVKPAPVHAPPHADARTLQLVRLSDAVSLVIETTEPITPERAEALRSAAEPLLRVIQSHQTLPPDQEST